MAPWYLSHCSNQLFSICPGFSQVSCSFYPAVCNAAWTLQTQASVCLIKAGDLQEMQG